jgi:hypothetical protein
VYGIKNSLSLNIYQLPFDFHFRIYNGVLCATSLTLKGLGGGGLTTVGLSSSAQAQRVSSELPQNCLYITHASFKSYKGFIAETFIFNGPFH